MSKEKEKLTESQLQADAYLQENIIEARTDFEKAVDVYRNYVSKSETDEERMRRIHKFRCGGW